MIVLKQQGIGVLLVNLGTPSQANAIAIKKYLAEFLRDRHVVDLNPLIWLPILHGIVIPKRISYIIAHYQKIWLNDQSPLLYYSQQLCEKLQKLRPDVQFELAMNYGEPTLESALQRLKQCSYIEVISMYPQYSTTTTLAVINKIKKITEQWQNKSNIHYRHDYADSNTYISALVQQIDHAICSNQPDVLMLSYHGIPISYIKKRHDEYPIRCELTTQLLKQALAPIYPHLDIIMTYQSRFGKGKWTEPNTSDILVELAKQKKSVAIICPGFAVDCIETLHEINIENRELFMHNGGQQFDYIPALNDSQLQIDLLLTLLDNNSTIDI